MGIGENEGVLFAHLGGYTSGVSTALARYPSVVVFGLRHDGYGEVGEDGQEIEKVKLVSQSVLKPH